MDQARLIEILKQVIQTDVDLIINEDVETLNIQREYSYFIFWTRLITVATLTVSRRLDGGLRVNCSVSKTWSRVHNEFQNLLFRKYLESLLREALFIAKKEGLHSESDLLIFDEA